jgi:small subunit ribosomal protein S9
MSYIAKIGRRKSSVAKVKVHSDGAPGIHINGKPLADYFPKFFASKLLVATSEMSIENTKIEFFVKGGGNTGQAEACRLALSKAMSEENDELKSVLRSRGWRTTDPRKVYSKRPGLKKARKAPQWVKR